MLIKFWILFLSIFVINCDKFKDKSNKYHSFKIDFDFTEIEGSLKIDEVNSLKKLLFHIQNIISKIINIE